MSEMSKPSKSKSKNKSKPSRKMIERLIKLLPDEEDDRWRPSVVKADDLLTLHSLLKTETREFRNYLRTHISKWLNCELHERQFGKDALAQMKNTNYKEHKELINAVATLTTICFSGF